MSTPPRKSALEDAIANVTPHITNWPEIIRNARHLSSEGQPSKGSGRSSKNSISDPTGSYATNGDTVDQHINATYGYARLLCYVADKFAGHCEFITTQGHNKDRSDTPALGAGPCLACARDVPGTSKHDAYTDERGIEREAQAEDRLKAGYCEADYRLWKRHDSPDRTPFEHWVRAQIASGELDRPLSPYSPEYRTARQHAEASAHTGPMSPAATAGDMP